MTYPLKLEVQLQDPLEKLVGFGRWTGRVIYLVKCTLEASLPLSTIVPLFIDNPECDVLVWGSRHEADETGILLASSCERLAALSSMLALYAIGRGFGFVNEVGVEDVEFVALDDLGGWVIVIVVRLVVFIPLVAHLAPVEIPGFARPVFVRPQWLRTRADRLLAGENLLVLTNALGEFSLVQGLGGL